MTWLLIVALVSGKAIALDVPSREQCFYMLESINAGTGYVTLMDGERLQIESALGCMTEHEFDLRKGAGA